MAVALPTSTPPPPRTVARLAFAEHRLNGQEDLLDPVFGERLVLRKGESFEDTVLVVNQNGHLMFADHVDGIIASQDGVLLHGGGIDVSQTQGNLRQFELLAKALEFRDAIGALGVIVEIFVERQKDREGAETKVWMADDGGIELLQQDGQGFLRIGGGFQSNDGDGRIQTAIGKKVVHVLGTGSSDGKHPERGGQQLSFLSRGRVARILRGEKMSSEQNDRCDQHQAHVRTP